MFEFVKKILEKDFELVREANAKKYQAEFEVVRGILSQIPYINEGGCGISSLAMFMWLEERKLLGKDTKIIYLSNWSHEHDTNARFIKGGTNEIDSCSHAIMYHNGKYLDCEEEIDVDRYLFRLDIPQKKTKHFILNSLRFASWNSRFDRKTQVPIIEKKLNLKLNIIS